MKPLKGKKIVSTALNLPGPTACHRLAKWGAEVIKVEPPRGDQLQDFYANWYKELNDNQKITKIDLKSPEGQREIYELLANADLLITSQLAESLEKFGLSASQLQDQGIQISVLNVFAYDDPDKPGHDLNFQVNNGLVSEHMPRALLADLAGAERIIAVATAMLLGEEKSLHQSLALNDVARDLAAPVRYGATVGEGPLSGHLPFYSIYKCLNGEVAVCAFEPQFQKGLLDVLKLDELTSANLAKVFGEMTVEQCLRLAEEFKLPISCSKN